MNKTQAQKLHKEMWNWLADNPTKEKSDWPKWENNGGKIAWIDNLCFACYVADRSRKEPYDDRCELCPVKWPRGLKYCEDYNGKLTVYEKWYNATNPKTRSRLAKQIANLPWK